MNFINPYLEIYYQPKELQKRFNIPFYKEVFWLFLKNLDNRLKMFKHRVNITFVESENEARIFQFGSIYENRVFINIDEFERFDENMKRKTLLEIVYSTFIELANEYDWDKEIINDAYNKSIEDKYQFQYQSEFKNSRNKQAKGSIEINLNGNAATLSANVVNLKTNEVFKNELLVVGEHILSWQRMIKQFGWYDNSKFGLKFLGGQLWIVLNLENMKTETIINPQKRLRSDIELYLNELYC